MNRKKSFAACSAALVLLFASQAIPAASQDAPKRRPRIAVLDFDYGTVQTASAAVFGTNIDVGKGIVDLLVTDLVKDGTYSIIERKALDKILAEQNFSNSDRADPNSAAKIGKLLGVDAIVEGSITEFGNETKKTNLGGGGGNWHGFGGGNADFGSSDFQQTIIGEATKAAVDQLTTNLVSQAARVGVRTVVVEGVVAAVDGGQVILNVGGNAGVKVGDTLQVVRVTKEIKDPTTGAILRRLTTTVGTVRATDVDPVSAICTPVSGSDFKAGDRVKTVTQ